MHRISTSFKFEHREVERSAGGTGSPPEPDLSDDVVDPGLKRGSRRNPLPMLLTDPGAPQPNQPKPNTNA